MILTLNKNSTINDMLNALNSYGVFKIDEFFSQELINGLRHDVTLMLDSGSDYEFGRSVRGGSLKTYSTKCPTVYKVFSSEWMKELNELYIGHNNGYCHEIYATYDHIPNAKLGRNGYLHFDRYWAFKFFIYLTDVDKDCGAFSCVPGSNKLGKELRENAWKETKEYSKVKNRILVDYSNMKEYADKIEPVEAKAGSIIVFDTDVFHMGGIVKNGKSRLIIRSHSRK